MNKAIFVLLATVVGFYVTGYCQKPCTEINKDPINSKEAFFTETFYFHQNTESVRSILDEVAKRVYPIDSCKQLGEEVINSWLTSLNTRHKTQIFDSVKVMISTSFLPKGTKSNHWIRILEFHFSSERLAEQAFILLNKGSLVEEILPYNQKFLYSEERLYLIDSEAFFDIDECYMGNLEYLIRALIN